jgi:Tol biopolymer transport system component
VTTGTQVIETLDVSPDGRWIAYSGNLRGHMDLYKMPLEGGQAVPLTSGAVGGEAPQWSPNGREIVFHSKSGVVASQIMLMSAEGGTPVALTNAAGSQYYPSWSPSGLEVSFFSTGPGRPGLWLLSRDSVGGAWHEAVPFTDCPTFGLHWAPDGSGALCQVDSSVVVLYSREGRVVWRRDFTATSRLTLRNIPSFSRDGRTLYAVADHQDGRRGVWAIPMAGGAPHLVVAFDDSALASFFDYVTVGPEHLYLTVSQYESDIWVANLRW